jgi:hypothetical protein
MNLDHSKAWPQFTVDDIWAELERHEIVDEDLFWTRFREARDAEGFAYWMRAIEHWDIQFLLQELGTRRIPEAQGLGAEEKIDNGDAVTRAALQQFYARLIHGSSFLYPVVNSTN